MSTISIMLFSDFHSKLFAFETNLSLISSIKTDSRRSLNEDPPITAPELLIVCGDLVQGTGDLDDFDAGILEITEQYNKIKEFLNMLCEEMFDGDNNKIIVVPGNHDVSWPHSIQSMEEKEYKSEYVRYLKTPAQNIRWSWGEDEPSFFEITNYEQYNQRMSPFSEFYGSLYNGAREYFLDPTKQFDIFVYPEKKLLIVGFNSCFYNDHLNEIGMIHPECLARCHSEISKEKYNAFLKISVCHHGVQGTPTMQDFMDERTYQSMLDKGFHIGFHGHYHKYNLVNIRFQVDPSLTIPVFGCGTLYSSSQSIPLGSSRQYSIIEIDPSFTNVRYHLRTAIEQAHGLPIWMPGNIIQNKGKSYLDVPITSFKPDIKREGEVSSVQEIPVDYKELMVIDDFIKNQEYQLALDRLVSLDNKNPIVRRLMIECNYFLENDDDCIALIGVPNTITEFTYLVDVLERNRKSPDLHEIIDQLDSHEIISNSELYKRIKKKLGGM